MKPKSFSASALNVAELCMARYKAENIERAKGYGASAASLGTSVHGALEEIVKAVKITDGGNPSYWDIDILAAFYRKSYMDTFGTADASGDMYDDGWDMLKTWFKRTDLLNIDVISCEVKENFPVKTSAGEIPFNYIWDRHDRLGPNSYRVVDYKSNRWGLSPADLKKKIQARCYGLAAQIKYPDAEEIWVQFDMLRHDPVGVVFSREENIATWKFIKELSEKILNTDPDYPPETLNAECRFCVRKLKCGALRRNVAVGGSLSISGAQEAVDLRAVLDYQQKAIASAINELDEIILTDARAQDILEFETDHNRLTVGISSQRAIDPAMAARVIGPKLMEKYAGVSLTMGNVDKLVKGKELTDEQKSQLKALVYKKGGEPRVKVASKTSLEAND